jgi:hypothetical protein
MPKEAMMLVWSSRFGRLRLALLLLGLLGSGCVPRTDLMDYRSRPGADLEAPHPNTSLVLFFRAGRMAGAVSSSIFDGTELVAVLMDRTYAVYETAPGAHRFMVVGEAADFMDADLVADKVYFATVRPRMGVWRARFSLKPITPRDEEWRKLRSWLEESHRITLNDGGRSWARDNAPSIREKHDGYLVRWLDKDERPALHPEDGVAFGDMP